MKFIAGFVLGLVLIPAAVYCYFYFGIAPVATASSPMPFEQRMARAALSARIEKEYPRTAPFKASGADLQHAAHLYREHCAICHGLPNQEATPTAYGMYPKPPQLWKHGVTDDPPGETYWKVANGIRMTGMPAYKARLADRDVWVLSLFLAQADKLPGDVRAVLVQPLHED